MGDALSTAWSASVHRLSATVEKLLRLGVGRQVAEPVSRRKSHDADWTTLDIEFGETTNSTQAGSTPSTGAKRNDESQASTPSRRTPTPATTTTKDADGFATANATRIVKVEYMANGTVDHPGIGQYRSQQTGESVSADAGHRGEANHQDWITQQGIMPKVSGK